MKIFRKNLYDLVDQLKKNKFFKNVSILAGGTGLAQVLVIAASPIITRIFTPEDFGTLAIFIAILATLGTISSFKYQLAIPLPEKDEDAIQILALCLILNFGYGLSIGVILYLLTPILSKFENIAVIIPYFWIISVSIIALGIYQTLKYWAIREAEFKYITQTKISQNVALIISQIGIGLMTSGPIGLLIGDAIGRSGGSGTLGWQARKKIIHLKKSISWTEIRYQAIRYRRFPIYSSASGLFNSLGLQLTPLLIAGILGPAVAGLYMLAHRVSGAPLKLIGDSYAQVFYKEAVDKLNESPAVLKKLYISQTKILLLIGIIPFFLFLSLGENGFSFIFGEEWAKSGLYVQIFAPMLLIQFIVVPLSQTLNIVQKQNLQLIWDVMRFALIGIIFLLINAFSIGDVYSILLISISMLVMYVVLFAITIYVL